MAPIKSMCVLAWKFFKFAAMTELLFKRQPTNAFACHPDKNHLIVEPLYRCDWMHISKRSLHIEYQSTARLSKSKNLECNFPENLFWTFGYILKRKNCKSEIKKLKRCEEKYFYAAEKTNCIERTQDINNRTKLKMYKSILINLYCWNARFPPLKSSACRPRKKSALSGYETAISIIGWSSYSIHCIVQLWTFLKLSVSPCICSCNK